MGGWWWWFKIQCAPKWDPKLIKWRPNGLSRWGLLCYISLYVPFQVSLIFAHNRARVIETETEWLYFIFLAVASLRSETDHETHWFDDASWWPFGLIFVPLWFQLAPFCFTLGIIFNVFNAFSTDPSNQTMQKMALTRRLNWCRKSAKICSHSANICKKLSET